MPESTERARLLAVTEAALAHLDLERLLDALLDRLNDILGTDTAAILLAEEERRTLRARAAKGLEEEVEQGFTLPIGAGFAGRIAATLEPVAISDLKPGEAVNPLLYEKGIRSLLGVPLVVEGRLVGVLHVGTVTTREWTKADSDLLQVAGDRVALAIEHARLFDAERSARSAAEDALTRVAQLQSLTEAALAYLDLDDLLRVLLDRVTEILAADTAVVLLVEDDGKILAARAAKGLEEEVERGFRLPVGRGFAGRVAAEMMPVRINELKPGDAANPLFYEKGVRSLMGVPLIIERRLVGVLHVGSLQQRDFTEADADLLQLVGDRVALAIEHDRLFSQHRVAQTLQRSLLPLELPQLAGLVFDARYLPAVASDAVGGDWYDVIPLSQGRVGVAIGDVVGHGLEAATLMGQLRTALHAYALEGLDPAEVGHRLGRFANSIAGAKMATFLYGVLDPDQESFRFIAGSHPPPLVVRPDGRAWVATLEPAPPLGVGAGALFTETEVEIPAGATLLLYTDGLVERRGTRLGEREEELIREAELAPFDPHLLCDHLIRTMLGPEGPEDDVALLAVQRLPVEDESIELTVAARAEELAAIRRVLRRWLAAHGADRDAVSAVMLASGEACANAIEHAYGPGDATFVFGARVDGDDAIVTITDSGHWRPARGQGRGRGLGLMETFMDEVAVEPGDEGTTVRLRRRIRGKEVENGCSPICA